MSYEQLDEDVVFDAPVLVEKSNADIRQNLIKVESALTEFESVNAGLTALAERYPVDAVIDVTTGKGMVEAVAHRAAWRDPRLAVERIRKQAKAPAIALGKDIDARAAWITEQLLIGEVPMDRQIKAEEARKEAIKQERINAEFGRVSAIQEAIAEIGMVAMAAAGKSSAHIAELIESQRAEELSLGVYQEMLPQAQAAQNACLVKLDLLHKAALHTESEAAKLAAERAELEALRKAAAEQKAKDEAAAKVEQERVAAEHAERQRVMNEQAAQNACLVKLDLLHKAAKLAAERAELEALRKAAAEQKAKDEAAAKVEQERVAAEHAERQRVMNEQAAELKAMQDAASAQQAEIDRQREVIARTAVAAIRWPEPEIVAAPAPTPIAAPAPAAVPRDALEPVALITTAVLGEHLGIAVNADLIAQLGFAGTKLSKPGTYWPESDVPAIRAALIEHIRTHRRA